jgi:hypothetical protein
MNDGDRPWTAAEREKSGHSMGMHGYNYTDLPISSYSVSGVGWGGDLDVSNETAGGGKTTCCASLPTRLPATYMVHWSRDDHRWCDVKVIFKGPIPDRPRFFNTHFFQDGHIEITISYEFTDLLVKQPSMEGGLSRKASGNMVMDEKVAKCRDAI